MNATFSWMDSGDPQARKAAEVVAATADFLILVDQDRRIAAVSGQFASKLVGIHGMLFVDTLHPDDRPQAEALLSRGTDDPNCHPALRHLLEDGTSFNVSYARTDLPDGGLLLVGRLSATDERPAQALARFEREVAPATTEARYRSLFETIAEPVILIDPDARKFDDMNPPAAALFGQLSGKWTMTPLGEVFLPEDIDWLVAIADGAVSDTERTIRLPSGDSVIARATLFRSYGGRQLMVRLFPGRITAERSENWSESLAASLLEKHADPVVLIDDDRVICWSNSAFIRQFGGPTASKLVGRRIDDVLPVFETALSMLISHARECERAVLAVGLGALDDVDEIMAIALGDGGHGGFGLLLRRSASDTLLAGGDHRADAAEPIADLVGNAPLKSIVRQTTDVIERACIEAALSLTNQNRAAAAEALGISRQSLYIKMHQFDLI